MFEFLLISLVFYGLGRLSGGEREAIKKTKKELKKLFKQKSPGVINYPTAKEQSYDGSEQEKIDKQMIAMQKERGIIPE